jgi:HK97 family phage major capsid protein
MPYGIFQTGPDDRPYCVYKVDENGDRVGDAIGCHATNDEAVDQVTAINISESGRSISKVAYGGAVRALPGHILEGALVVFSPEAKERDVYGTYFQQDTDIGWEGKELRTATYEHGLEPQFGDRKVGEGLRLRNIDDFGVWVQNQLDESDEYDMAIYELAKRGKLGMSSGTAEHMVKIAPDGKFLRWLIVEGAYTIKPAEIRTKGLVVPIRSFKSHDPFALLEEPEPGAERPRGVRTGQEPQERAYKPYNFKAFLGGIEMPGNIEALLAAIMGMVEGELSPEKQAELNAFLAGYQVSGDMPVHEDEPMMDAQPAQLNVDALISELKKKGFKFADETPDPAPQAPPARHAPPYAPFSPTETDEEKTARERAESMRSIHMLRYGEDAVDDPTALALREVYDGDYRQVAYEQNVAFSRYLRTGRVDAIDEKKLRRQIWSVRNVVSMLRQGMPISAIRTTMVEGTDELGGYAVPPQRYDELIKRIMGLTAVRGGGARVIQTASNSAEWMKVTGGGDRYPSGLRGQWGDETTPGDEKNFTVGLETIPVNIYSYPVKFSRALLEDATNMEDIFFGLVADTLAIDEDEAFLIGDGANKPRGILPNSTNTDSLSEVVSGNATLLTWTGLKLLRRGIASQYRTLNRASWIGESDTGGAIEAFEDGEGRAYVDALVAGEPFPKLRGIWRESEALPTIGAGTYPLIYGALEGYFIVERLGMAVERFHDSGTGVKVFQFSVYRRLGGKVMEPWKLAVQKVAAS